MIHKVNRYLLDEKANSGPLLLPTQELAVTAKAMKVSQRRVRRISSVANRKRETVPQHQKPLWYSTMEVMSVPGTDFDDLHLCVLSTFLRFYERNEYSTFSKLAEDLDEKVSYTGSVRFLHRVLLTTGFRFSKIDGHKFLME